MPSERRVARPIGFRVLLPCLGLGLLLFRSGGDSSPRPGPEDPDPWRIPDRSHTWSFPRDHRAHPEYRTEWWYVTGHLRGRDGGEPELGYQFTLFRVGLVPEAPGWRSTWDTRGLVLGHLAVTDPGRGLHVFSETLVREIPLLGGFPEAPDPRLAWCRSPAGTSGVWELRAVDGGFEILAADEVRGVALRLVLGEIAPIVFHGPGGWSAKDAAGRAASLYYSIPRLETRGTVEVAGRRVEVDGSSWLDREWSSRGLSGSDVGWDWLSLQLEDGRNLMVYRLRDAGGSSTFGHATLTSPDGPPTYLEPGDWRMTPGRTWTSPRTEITYPVEWELEISAVDLALRIVPRWDAQENVSELPGGVPYWEGAVIAVDTRGSRVGRGYLELTGYGAGSRPAL